MKQTTLVFLSLLVASLCHAQFGLQEIEVRVEAPGLAKSLKKKMTSAYTVTTEGLPVIQQSEWLQYLNNLKKQDIRIKFFTIGSADSDTPEARHFSVYVLPQQNRYWLQPHTPENPAKSIYGPILILKEGEIQSE